MANEDNTHDSAGINITETNIGMFGIYLDKFMHIITLQTSW